MDLEGLYTPNHVERLKARSFLRSIAFFDDFSASFEYRDRFSVLENIAQFDYEKKPYKDDLYFLCKFVEPALKAIFSNLNTNICRKHLKMPLEKAREFDAKCALDLAKRPGRSLKEKLCDNKVLGVKRYENVNTHENRFLKRFIKELLRIVDRREIEFQRVFEELIFSIKSFLKSGVAQQIDEKQAIIPNNLLHFDKHYKRIFKAHDWLYNDVGSLMNLDQIFYLEYLYQAQFYTSIKIEPTLIKNEQDLYALIRNSFPIKDLSFEKMRLKAKEFLENKLKQPINLNQEIPQLELCKGVYKEMYIDMFDPKPFALLVGNDILKLSLLAKKLVKKQENNIYINANGAKGEIDKKGYLANALKDYDETLVEAFMRDFKERYKIEKLYYLLDDNIKNFEFAKIKHKISLYFKDAKFYPKSVALGFSFLFENKLKKNDRLRYNGVDLVVKENHKSKTFNRCGLVLERQKSDDSKKALTLQDSFIKEDLILENFFIKKALKNFKIALGLEKEGFILYKECLPKLSMEVIKDGRFKNFEIIKDKTILGDKETLEIETPFIIPKGLESLALPLILNEEKIAYQGKIISKDFPLENDEKYKLTLTYDTGTEFNYVLEFKPVNNDLKPIVIEWQRIDTKGVELPTPDPIKKPSIDELKNDFNPKRGKSSDLFEWVLEHLGILKDLNSTPGFFLKGEIKHLEKKLECGGISKIGKDRNNQLFYIVETDDKEVFCHSSQCESEDELLLGVRVCLEVRPDREDPSKYQGKIYGLEENKEIILLNTAKNNYQRKHPDEKIKHRIKALKNIKYPCLKIFSHYTLEELETLNPEFATPFKEYLRRLEKYYFDPQTDRDFKKELLDFFSRLNDSIPEKLQQEFIELPFAKLYPTDFLLSRCLGSLEKDFQKTIFKNLEVAFFNPKIDQEICFKILSIVARASWNNEKFLKNLMAQTSLEQQKGFLKRIEECLKNPEPSSACELLLAFLSYRNAKRELELIPESERAMRLLDSIDKAIKEEIEIKSFVKLELKNQSFNNIPPLLLALRLYLRGDLEGVGIEIKGTEEDE
ncbi:hypothetical protein HPSH417_04800 [Helicobacter pylori Shi417]|uniref:DUF2357 domain-containing protein n=1 Tax=Helicobacter pylori TaxID=210 RepID=UPI0002595BDE|nr:DUF2357 domain-containing protein [Helicobacter pylori]AFH98095.1 hypothetical protein HPSH417_04800 [Helicobacter pylori Shi417]